MYVGVESCVISEICLKLCHKFWQLFKKYIGRNACTDTHLYLYLYLYIEREKEKRHLER